MHNSCQYVCKVKCRNYTCRSAGDACMLASRSLIEAQQRRKAAEEARAGVLRDSILRDAYASRTDSSFWKAIQQVPRDVCAELKTITGACDSLL